MLGGMFGQRRSSRESALEAASITSDFVELAAARLRGRGAELKRASGAPCRVTSLLELEEGLEYTTQAGNTLVLTSRQKGEALLAGKVTLSALLPGESPPPPARASLQTAP